MPADRHPDVFVSYARSDRRTEAHAVVAAIETALGVPDIHPSRCYLDTRDAPTEKDFSEDILEALLASRVVVVLPSEAYFRRWWCLKEWHLALSPHRRRAPVAIAEEHAAPCTLQHLVLAWAPELGREVVDQIPPALRTMNHPTLPDVAAIAAVVAARLAEAPPTLAERLAAEGLLELVRSEFGGETRVPPPIPLAGVPHDPRAIAPSLGGGFVGRAEELWRLHTLLVGRGDPTRVAAVGVAVRGGAGCGKSRLAREYLHRFGPIHFRGGLFWIDAERLPSELEAQHHAMLLALDGSTPSLDELRARKIDVAALLGRTLARRPAEPRLLVVVDNFPESAPGDPPPSLDTLLPGRHAVTLIVTARARVVAGEGSLPELPLGTLAASSGVELLRRDLLDDDATSIDASAWSEIAEWAGGLPLALDLLNQAMVAATLRPRELLELARAPASEVIDGGAVDALDEQVQGLRELVPADRLRGVSAAFGASYSRLGPAAQRVARLLAWMAPATVPDELADAACRHGAGPRGAGAVRGLLLSRSFLSAGPGGVAMHRLLAEYLRGQSAADGLDWLTAAAALDDVFTIRECEDGPSRVRMQSMLGAVERVASRARAASALGWAEVGERCFGLGTAALALGERSVGIDGLLVARVALESAIDQFQPEVAPQPRAASLSNLAVALREIADRRGSSHDGWLAIHACRLAVAAFSRDEEPQTWARAQTMLGDALFGWGSNTGSAEYLLEAVRAYDASLAVAGLGEAARVARQVSRAAILVTISEVNGRLDAAEEAVSQLRAALLAIDRGTEPDRWAHAKLNLGAALLQRAALRPDRSDLAESVEACRDSAAEYRRLGMPVSLATALSGMGRALEATAASDGSPDRLCEARAAYLLALEIHGELMPRATAELRSRLQRIDARLGEEPASRT